MRKLFAVIIALIGFITSATAQHLPLAAEDVLKQACEKAGKENKNVFIMFTASWCGWCKRMDKSLEDMACKDFFNKNYIVRHLVVDEPPDKHNLENPGAKDFRAKYNGEGLGIPYWLIFDKTGSLLADSRILKSTGGVESYDNIGCPATEKEVEHFIKALEKTSVLSSRQSESIRKRFRENDN